MVGGLRLPSIFFRERNMDVYYLASLKLSGWLSKTSQFTTTLADARIFDREEALATCRRYKQNHHVLVPVRQQDMQEI